MEKAGWGKSVNIGLIMEDALCQLKWDVGV